MKSVRIFALSTLLACLAACGPSAPVLLNGSQEGVVVRYNQSRNTASDATAAADRFCAQYGRKAVAGIGDASTGDTFVTFTCVAR